MKRFILSVAFVLALAPAVSQAMQEQNTYLPNPQMPPTITGHVTAVSDHSMMVTSDEGEKITLDVDSRSVMPAKLDVGQHVRIEFHLMESGRYLVKRVTPIRTGEGTTATIAPWETEPQARATEKTTTHTHDGDVATTTTTTTTYESSTADETPASTEPARDENLPATSSPRPLVEAIGAAALVAGAVLWFVRRRRRAA